MEDQPEMEICGDHVLMLFDQWTWDVPVRTALWFVTGFCTVLVGAAGAVGNLYSIFMIGKFKIRKTVIIFLTALAFWDAGVSFCSLPLYAAAEMLKPFTGEFMVTQYVTVVFHPISNITMTAAIWMLLIITGERYWAISNPLRHRVIDTEKRAKCICASVFLCALIYCTSIFFELKVLNCVHNVTGETIHYAWASDMRQNRLYIAIYSILFNSVFISIGPFSLMTMLTLRMIILVRQARRNRAAALKCTGEKAGRETTTIMLLAVTGKFLISNFLQILLNTWEALYPEMNNSVTFLVFVDLSNFLVVLNSATDCLVYFRWRRAMCRNPTNDTKTERSRTMQAMSHSVSQHNQSPSTTIGHQARYMSLETTAASDDSYFTPEEAASLRSSWNYMQVSSARVYVGRRILLTILRRRPNLGQHLGYSSLDFAEHDQRIEAEAERITMCLEQTVNSASQIHREEELVSLLKNVSRKHREMNVCFNAELWNLFKSSLIEHMVSYGDSGEETEALQRVWMKVACFMIRIMKQTDFETRKLSSQNQFRKKSPSVIGCGQRL